MEKELVTIIAWIIVAGALLGALFLLAFRNEDFYVCSCCGEILTPLNSHKEHASVCCICFDHKKGVSHSATV